MRRSAIALVLALTVSTTAHAAPPASPTSTSPSAAEPAAAEPAFARPGEQERQELEQETKLDLSKPWQRYQSERKGENFYQFVAKDFSRKRNIGRGLTVGGAVGLLLGVSLFSIGIPRPEQPIPLTASGYVIMGVSGAVTIAGAVVWGVFFKRMEKLEVAEDRGLALGKRARLLSLSPAGFRLAF